MAEITYDELLAVRARLDRGETTIEQAAEQYSLPALAEALRMTRGMLQAIANGWSQEQLLTRPASTTSATGGEDRWSATEALTHLCVTQSWYMLHMDRLLGRRAHYDEMPHGLGDQARQDVMKAELEEKLRTATRRLLDYIASIPADADLTALRDSTFFGDLSLRGWVMLAVGHDLDHLAQIQRVAEGHGFPRAPN